MDDRFVVHAWRKVPQVFALPEAATVGYDYQWAEVWRGGSLRGLASIVRRLRKGGCRAIRVEWRP